MTKLSSELLTEQFGPVEVEIIYQQDDTRAIATKSTDTGQILEISLVKFIQAGVEQFPEIHNQILSGDSMGETFRAHGVDFIRGGGQPTALALPPNFQKIFADSRPATVMEVLVSVGSESVPYAELLETYHPDVNWGDRSETDPDQDTLQSIKELDGLLAGWQ